MNATKKHGTDDVLQLHQKIAELERSETEHRKTEEELWNALERVKEEKARSEAIIAEIGDAITIQDTEYKILYQNQVAIDLIGNHVGEYCYMAYEGMERTCDGCPVAMAFRDGKVHTVVRTVQTGPDKGMRYLENTASVVRGADGKIIAGIEVVRDITDRKQLEFSLEEQKKFAEGLIENSAVATFVLDPAHTIVMWNKACEELTGVPAVAMIGTSNQWKPFYAQQRPALADIVMDAAFDKLPGLYQTYEKSALATNALHAEGWYAKLNGKDRYILFDAAPLYDRSGKTIAVVETLQDITERKRVEEFYEENRNILRAITDTAPDAIVLIDDEGKVLYWNPSAASMLGYSGENILGKNITTIIPERYRASHGAAFRKFVETGEGALLGRTYEVFARRKDGTEIPVELSISGVWLKEKWHAAGIIREITERKKLEDQLRQAQKMEAIGQLAGGIAHDFNNILSVIVGYGHLLQVKMREDDPLRVNVEHILAAAGRAAQLTHSLLAFSRKQIINPRPVDLNAVVQRVGTMLMRLIGEDVDLRLSLSKKRLTVLADSSQLEQVLMNFATNARDAMPQGGSFSIATDLVEVDDSFSRAHGYGEPGAYAMISLADTGVGMDETTRKKIFDPFFTTKEPGRGTGLGLSIVYGIIKQHKGYINVYSEPGKGTTFRIYLPVVQEEVETRKDNALPAREIGGSETILLAEDDKALRTLSRTILEEFGYRVIEADDGVDALEKFLLYKDAIHLVILDMIMPRKGGKETYDEIAKARPEVKAIFMSGYTADKVHLDDIFARGIELLLKPVSPRVLLKKVREALDKKSV